MNLIHHKKHRCQHPPAEAGGHGLVQAWKFDLDYTSDFNYSFAALRSFNLSRRILISGAGGASLKSSIATGASGCVPQGSNSEHDQLIDQDSSCNLNASISPMRPVKSFQPELI